jgi:hypothetical protein
MASWAWAGRETLVGWGATIHVSGDHEITSRGELIVGELDRRTTQRVERLKSKPGVDAPTVTSTNIYGAQWSKRPSIAQSPHWGL